MLLLSKYLCETRPPLGMCEFRDSDGALWGSLNAGVPAMLSECGIAQKEGLPCHKKGLYFG